MLSVELAVFQLEAESVKALARTLMVAVPVLPEVAVNEAEYEVPEPVKLASDPPETVTSDTTKFVDASDKVNVMVSL